MTSISSRRQKGLGIIEVLVALVVVSFGVLGMASLQLTGMKHSTSGFNRSKALLLAENMATRMRINREGVVALEYNGFDTATDIDCAAKPDPYCQAHPGGAAQQCSVAELAAFDLFSVACGDWGATGANAGIIGMLPPGSNMSVACEGVPCTDDSVYTIRVNWPEGRTASSEEVADVRSVQLRLRP